jgi:hypothetical protein
MPGLPIPAKQLNGSKFRHREKVGAGVPAHDLQDFSLNGVLLPRFTGFATNDPDHPRLECTTDEQNLPIFNLLFNYVSSKIS